MNDNLENVEAGIDIGTSDSAVAEDQGSNFQSTRPPRRNEPQDAVRRNAQIRSREVRVIGADGEQLGVLSRLEAIDIAREQGYDLVEVASTADPPVCRIMDYGKYKYEQQKKKQDAKKRQTVVHIKEIKLRPKTDEHDFETKLKHIRRFLEGGDRVKVTIFFRGREIVHKERGVAVIDRVIEETKDLARVDQEPRPEGRTLQMLLAPIVKKQSVV
jgi:translation initiation factor IF-3